MLVRELGAQHFINYQLQRVLAADVQYDLILDSVGTLDKGQARMALKKGGRLVNVAGGELAREGRQQVEKLAQYFAAGGLQAVIETVLPLDEVQKAHRIVDSGHKRGSVILLLHEEEGC